MRVTSLECPCREVVTLDFVSHRRISPLVKPIATWMPLGLKLTAADAEVTGFDSVIWPVSKSRILNSELEPIANRFPEGSKEIWLGALMVKVFSSTPVSDSKILMELPPLLLSASHLPSGENANSRPAADFLI